MKDFFFNKQFTVLVFFAVIFSVFAPYIKAQQKRELTQEVDDKRAQKRIALVIGNGAYTKAKPLPNPPNDAADMTKALKELGFEVISGVNQDKRQMENLIREFGTKLSSSDGIGLFYYAGHGLQVGGENFLVPVDADIPEEDEVSYSAVSINRVLSKMATAKNDLNIIILDACRNNPFARSWSSYRDSGNNDGLAKISPPTGTLVLYATEPGKVASDGAGRNGLFTEALLKQITKPNLEYDQLVKAVSTDVWQKSNKQQLPWKEGNSLQDFYFAGNQQKANVSNQNDKTNDSIIVAKDKTAQEKEAWDLVKNSTDAEDFRLFLKEFPNGTNAEKSKIRLEELVWFSVKTSDDKAKVQSYLTEFSNGANASAARIKLRQLKSKNNVLSGNGISILYGSLVSFENAAITLLINGKESKFQISEVNEINFENSEEIRSKGLIQLKDGSRIRAALQKYSESNFILIVGEGAKQRQLNVYADEVASITLETKQSTPKTDGAEQTSENNLKPIVFNVKVLSDKTANGWTNSGWVVNKGQRIRVKATGIIALGNGRYSNPLGISSLFDNDKLIESEATGGLIAVIGDDNNEFFFIGESRDFIATRNGALFFGVNEGNLTDNSGSYEVTIEIFPSQ